MTSGTHVVSLRLQTFQNGVRNGRWLYISVLSRTAVGIFLYFIFQFAMRLDGSFCTVDPMYHEESRGLSAWMALERENTGRGQDGTEAFASHAKNQGVTARRDGIATLQEKRTGLSRYPVHPQISRKEPSASRKCSSRLIMIITGQTTLV